MPYILTFDIETTGIPSERNTIPTVDNTKIWDGARIIQIAYVVGDAHTGVCVKEISHVICPSGTFHISPENSKIHGFSTSQVSQGVALQSALSEMYADLLKFEVTNLVSHNIEFDYNVLLSEIMRLKKPESVSTSNIPDLLSKLNTTPKYCTMQSSCNLTKLSPKRRGMYKYPKLVELCSHLNVPVDSSSLHCALYDAKKTWQCYLTLCNIAQ